MVKQSSGINQDLLCWEPSSSALKALVLLNHARYFLMLYERNLLLMCNLLKDELCS